MRKFVEHLIDSKKFIHDMKGLNIIYDGHDFQVIDSGPLYKMEHSKLKKEYRKHDNFEMIHENFAHGIEHFYSR